MLRARHLFVPTILATLVCAPAISAEVESSATHGTGAAASGTDAGGSAQESAVNRGLSDTAITAKVKARLLWDSVTEGLDISVSTQAGVVTLSGSVDNRSQEVRAREIATDTEGVKSVRTDLRIAESGVDRAAKKAQAAADAVKGDAKDAWISGKVTKTIALDKRFVDSQVDVHTDQGVVTLVGKVDSPEERQQMIAAVRDIDGVRDVHANIEIR